MNAVYPGAEPEKIVSSILSRARQRMESGLDEDNLEVFALPLRPNGPKGIYFGLLLECLVCLFVGMTGVEAAGGTKLSRLWFCPQDTAARLPLQSVGAWRVRVRKYQQSGGSPGIRFGLGCSRMRHAAIYGARREEGTGTSI